MTSRAAGGVLACLLLGWGVAQAQMVVGPNISPNQSRDAQAPLPAPVVRKLPAPGRAINIGTGTTVGIYHAAGSAVCRLLSHAPQSHDLACTALYSKGSAQNVPELKEGRINFALLQSDVQYFAWYGQRVFGALGPTPQLRHVATLMPEAVTVVARNGSGITTAAELAGRRVNLGQLGSGTFVVREMLMTVYPQMQDITIVPDLQTALAADALCRGRIDAFAFVAGNPNPLVQQATTACGAYLVPVEGAAIDRLLASYPFYARTIVPGGTYAGNPGDVRTVGVHATLVTRADVPEQLVYQVTRALYEGLPEFRRLHLAFTRFDRTSLAAACNTAPLHPGAARYLKEAGIKQGPCSR